MSNPALLLTEKLREAASAEEPLAFRQAPHNLEAEQALLGAIFVNNEALDRVSGFLSPSHFFDPLHGRIFETLATLIHAGKIATPITVKSFFENAEPIDASTSVPQYLGRLAANATTIINAAEYGRTVYDLATRRALIVIGEDMVNAAYEAGVDQTPRSQIEEAEGRLYGLAEQNKYGQGFETFQNALTTAINMANSAFQRAGHLSGASTGLSDLDHKLGGLQRSDLIILAGRPSMGKTALATNIAYNVARAYRAETGPDGRDVTVDGGVVGFFSLEMSAEQLATRILAEQAEISSEKIRRGMIDDGEFRKLAETAAEMSRIPLYIDQTGGITIAQLSARARKLKRQHGLDLLVVDYLQLLAGSKKGDANRVQEITEITTGLKALAKELNELVYVIDEGRRKQDDLRAATARLEDDRLQMATLVEARKQAMTERQKDLWVTPEALARHLEEADVGSDGEDPEQPVAAHPRRYGVARPRGELAQDGAEAHRLAGCAVDHREPLLGLGFFDRFECLLRSRHRATSSAFFT